MDWSYQRAIAISIDMLEPTRMLVAKHLRAIRHIALEDARKCALDDVDLTGESKDFQEGAVWMQGEIAKRIKKL